MVMLATLRAAAAFIVVIEEEGAILGIEEGNTAELTCYYRQQERAKPSRLSCGRHVVRLSGNFMNPKVDC